MLANTYAVNAQIGSLRQDVHFKTESLYRLIDFIANELPKWRDRPERARETSETVLTAQLSRHLNSASRHSMWDFLQFATEAPDEKHIGRKIDLAVSPTDATVWISGRRYSDLDTLLPIECKRLPTPKDPKRDEWEYVVNRMATTGGIQRFKDGHHGSAHNLGAMIAYVQQGTATEWHARVAGWIAQLQKSSATDWGSDGVIRLLTETTVSGLTTYCSTHKRVDALSEIELRHLWLEMR